MSWYPMPDKSRRPNPSHDVVAKKAHNTRLCQAPEESTLSRACGERLSTLVNGRVTYADGTMTIKDAPTDSMGTDSLIHTEILSLSVPKLRRLYELT